MTLRDSVTTLARRLLAPQQRAQIAALQRKYGLHSHPTGAIEFGHLRRITPISSAFGLDRGQPIDRYYIEKFLASCMDDIHGRVLELGDAFYTNKYGGKKVEHSDVLHIVEGNPDATIVGDLSHAPQIPSNTFDGIICTQSLQMIVDMRAALRTLHRILKPGGVLLLTSSGISKVGRRLGRDDWGEYWRLTAQGAAILFDETFPGAEFKVTAYGNVLSAIAYLHGLAREELTEAELDAADPDFEVIVAVRARKIAREGG